MAAGVFMAVVGAILTFAVRVDAPGIDLKVVGIILMVAGAAVIVYARRATQHERVITRVEDPAEPGGPKRTVRQVIRDTDVD